MLPYFGKSFLRMHLLSKMLQRDMINSFNRSLGTVDMLHNNELPRVHDNAFYKRTVTINDNGNVKVKTMLKEPGKDWSIDVKEYNKDQATAIEQDKGVQKKPEALEQSKTDKIQDSKTATSEESQRSMESGKEELKSAVKDNTQSAPEEISKSEFQKIETAKDQKIVEKREKESAQVMDPKRYQSPFDEINSIFDSMEREFEDSWRRRFGVFENQIAPRDVTPFDEIDAMFSRMERDMMYPFRRSFDFFDPFFIEDFSAEQPKSTNAKESKVKEVAKDSQTLKKEETAQLNNQQN